MPALLGELDYRGLRAAADAIGLPEFEPRAVSHGFIVPSICGGDIAGAERSDIGSFEHLLKLLNFTDNALDIQSTTSIAE